MMKPSRLLLLSMLGVLPVLSCSDFWPTDEPEVSAETRFQELEKRLLQAESVRLKGGVGSTGALTSALEGEALLGSGNRAHLEFAGEFESKSALLALVSDGNRMWGGNGTDWFEEDAPPALNEGIVLGFTRMGILHNLAVLRGAGPPEGTDGGIRDWLTVTNFAWGEPETIEGVPTETVIFDIFVRGEPAAKAMLWLNAETGLPVQREQTVRFPGGEMKAVEIYEVVEIGAELDPNEFVVP